LKHKAQEDLATPTANHLTGEALCSLAIDYLFRNNWKED